MSNKNDLNYIPDDDQQQDEALLFNDIDTQIDTDAASVLTAELNNPSQEIGADVEAIMTEGFVQPDGEIGVDIEAVLAAGLVDPSATVRVDPGVIPETDESALAPALADIGSDAFPEALPEEQVDPLLPDVLAADSTAFFLMEDQAFQGDVSDDAPSASEPQCADSAVSSPEAFDVPMDAPAPPAEPDFLPEDTASDEQNTPSCIPEEQIAENVSDEAPVSVSNDKTQILDTDNPLYHALLADPVLGNEINADEHAAYSAGLVHPDEADIESIIAESAPEDLSSEGEQMLSPDNEDYLETHVSFTDDPVIQDYVDPNHPLDAPAEEAAEPAEVEPELPKRRPRMKKGYGLLGIPHVLSTVIWLAIVVAIGVSLGRMIWVCAAEVLAFGKPDQEYTITITDADNIETVASKLNHAGLIKYPELFKLYADITNAEEDLAAGTFTLNSKYDYNALVKAMTFHSTARATVEVIIPEGYSCAQIFALLEEKGVCPASELEEYAANGEIKERWFLEGIERGNKYCLEGYLFPDTYEFYTDDEAGRVLGKFLDNFDNRFTDIMKDKIDPLNARMAEILTSRGYTQDYIDAHKFTIREIIIIASMIEKETASDTESYDISSVIYNRLTNPRDYLYLNIDATIIYALDGNIDPATGKTKPLTKEDLQLVSPYNTYTNPGLIPGPISNPGRNSINAALDPNDTKYYFYVYNPNTSKHLFAKTPEEHDRNVEYVRSLENDNA